MEGVWLGLDFGNTLLKAARIRAGAPPEPLGDVDFRRPLPAAVADGTEGAIVSSVRSEGTTMALLGGLPGRLVLVDEVLPEAEVGVEGYGEPPMGEDRRLHFLGLRALWPKGPVAAAAAGTVLTLSAWDGEGAFAGGYLFPGRALLLAALGRTGRLPDVPPGRVSSLEPGRDTANQIRAGVDGGLAAALSSLAGALDEAAGGARWALTGGDAAVLAPHAPAAWRHEPDLLWLGMTALLERL